MLVVSEIIQLLIVTNKTPENSLSVRLHLFCKYKVQIMSIN